MKEKLMNTLKNKKIMIIGSVCIIALIISGSILFLTKNDEGGSIFSESKNPNLKYNDNKEFKQDIEERGLLFKNIECTFDGNESMLSYIIINKTDKDIQLGEYDLLVKNSKGEVLVTISPNLEQVLKKDEELEIRNAVNIDITDAAILELDLKDINK